MTSRHLLLIIKNFVLITRRLFCILLLLACNRVAGQQCVVTNSVVATPPASGSQEVLVSRIDTEYYSTLRARIYDTYDSTGRGNYTSIDTLNLFWRNYHGLLPSGPLNRCGVWGEHDTQLSALAFASIFLHRKLITWAFQRITAGCSK